MYKIILLFFLINIYGFAEGVRRNDYFPLTVGNYYIYSEFQKGYNNYIRSDIIKDSLINDREYFYVTNNPKFQNGWVRTDSITGSLYIYDTSSFCKIYNKEKLVDSLGADSNYLVHNCDAFCKCTGIQPDSIFNLHSESISFRYLYPNTNNYWRYNEHIGLTYYVYITGTGEIAYKHEYILTGCFINGIIYGDTSVYTGIKKLGEIVPCEYSLYQNYPNPFEKKTKIKFGISEECFVSVKVFDNNKTIISELINCTQKPGTYQTEFDGTDLPAGIYFYEITAGDFTEKKKMIIMK